jgi:hypothetical protein
MENNQAEETFGPIRRFSIGVITGLGRRATTHILPDVVEDKPSPQESQITKENQDA